MSDKVGMKCPGCGARFVVSAERKKVRCPKCQEVIALPGSTGSDSTGSGEILREDRGSRSGEQPVLKRSQSSGEIPRVARQSPSGEQPVLKRSPSSDDILREDDDPPRPERAMPKRSRTPSEFLSEERESSSPEPAVLKRSRNEYAIAAPSTTPDEFSTPRSRSKGFPPMVVGGIALAVVGVAAVAFMGQGSNSPPVPRHDAPPAGGGQNPFDTRPASVPQQTGIQGTATQGTVAPTTVSQPTTSSSPSIASRGPLSSSQGSSAQGQAATARNSAGAGRGEPSSDDTEPAISSRTPAVRELKTRPLPRITTDAENFRFVEISTDGNVLATASGSGKSVEVWEAKTGKRWGTIPLAKGSAERAAFTFDGRLVAIADSEGFVSVFDVLSGKRLKYFQVAMGSLDALGLSYDGNLALAGVAEHAPSLWNVVTMKRIGADRPEDGRTTVFAIAPRLASVVAANDRGLLQSLDFRTGKVLRTLQVGLRPVRAIRFSHTERLLAVATELGLFSGLVASGAVTALEEGEPYGPLAFFPDGESLIAMAPSRIEVWDVEKRRKTDSVELDPPWDGRFGAMSGDGSIVVRPISGSELEVLEIPLAKRGNQ